MKKIRLTADQIYDRLIETDKILTLEGRIRFDLGGVDIIVKQRDVVGNIMQEWIAGWLDKNNIEYAVNENTQMPPDFYLNPDNLKENLLEIKAFNYNATPGFDIAAFDMFEREIKKKPYVLDTTYLIFGYDMSSDGVVTIKQVWKKKVWEITRPMKDKKKIEWAISLQIKDGVVHKIRPAKWYGTQTKYKIFTCVEHFLSAIENAVYNNNDTKDDAPGWMQQMEKNYNEYYNTSIHIPRWYEIQNEYIIPQKIATKKKKSTKKKKTKKTAKSKVN